jgi:hypothetical protein
MTDQPPKPDLKEDAPTNNVGNGNIAGAGIGPQGEPGVDNKKKRKKKEVIMGVLKRHS